jgi:hypothetical protein
MTYLHPLLGAGVLALLVYTGVLGLCGRGGQRHGTAHRARHVRWAYRLYAAVLVTWLTGAAATAFARPDLGFAASLHFRTATLLVALLTGSALTARLMRRGSDAARGWHPWLGAAAMLLAAVHAAAGLRLTP